MHHQFNDYTDIFIHLKVARQEKFMKIIDSSFKTYRSGHFSPPEKRELSTVLKHISTVLILYSRGPLGLCEELGRNINQHHMKGKILITSRHFES